MEERRKIVRIYVMVKNRDKNIGVLGEFSRYIYIYIYGDRNVCERERERRERKRERYRLIS